MISIIIEFIINTPSINDIYYYSFYDIFKVIDNPSIGLCLLAINKSDSMLQYVNNQTNYICLEAIKQNSNTLQCIKNSTENIYLEAVKQTGHFLAGCGLRNYMYMVAGQGRRCLNIL